MRIGLYSDLILCRRLLSYARGYGWHLAGIVLLSVLAPACALLYPLPLKIAVDSFLGSHPIPSFISVIIPAAVTESKKSVLILAACLLIGIALLNQLQRAAVSLLSSYTGSHLVQNFRGQLFRHIQQLSFSFHESRGIVNSTYRILTDAASIQDILVDGLVGLLSAGVMFAGLLYICTRLDLQLALVAFCISPFLLLFSRLYRRRLRSQWRELKEVESSVMSIAQEVLGTLRVVKAFAREEREQQRFSETSTQGVHARLRAASLQRQLSFCIVLTTAVGEALVLIVGMDHVQRGVLSLGELLVIMAYLRRLYDPIRDSIQKSANLQSALASAERVIALLDETPTIMERPGAQSLVRTAGGIVFCNVSFAFTKDRSVLHGISFQVAPGSRVHVYGASGAGKTTLISLLTRFYDPTDGQILLDGVDLRDYKIADLRNQFAFVPQDPVLFSTTIAENIAYANPGANEEDVLRAAKAANAHDFITKLPQGYNTKVGERGMSLSGGERQRVALARAFLKDAPILILDEPTSSIDPRSEAAILEAMGRLMRGRTTFMIAHRVSAMANFDLLVHVENGKLVSAIPATQTTGATALAR